MSAEAIRRQIESLRAEADRLESRNCTGLTARWCPVHGDCTCNDDDRVEWELDSLDDPLCPLHAAESSHAATDLAVSR